MNKIYKFLVMILSLLIIAPINAQNGFVKNKLNYFPTSTPTITKSDALKKINTTYSGIITVTDDNLQSLIDQGVKIRSKSGNFATITFPSNALNQLFNIKTVAGFTPACPVELDLDVSSPSINWEQTQRDAWQYTGKDIIVGIIDANIDYTHDSFLKADGTSRILYLWDQFGTSAPHPSPFGYGTEWTDSDIDAGSCSINHTSHHGTHVTGIAAGDDSKYTGIASEAEIIFVNFDRSDHSKVIDGIGYIAQKAIALDKPWVVNLSLGKNYGPRNGTSPFEQFITNIANDPSYGKGRIVVTSAGNMGFDKDNDEVKNNLSKYEENKFHCGADYNATRSFETETTTIFDNEQAWIEIWYPATGDYHISLRSPNDARVQMVDQYGNPYWGDPFSDLKFGPDEGTGDPGYFYITEDGAIAVHNAHWNTTDWTDPFPATQEKQILIVLLDYDDGSNVYDLETGDWEIRMTDGSGRWDAYLIPSMKQIDKIMIKESDYDPSRILGEPGNANQVITVGSYNSKNTWKDKNNNTQPSSYSTQFYPSGFPINAVSFFSSSGPTLDDRDKPEIFAPGAYICSAANSFYSTPAAWQMENDYHVNTRGTSMAAPHVTGAVALLLEQNCSLIAEGEETEYWDYDDIINKLESGGTLKKPTAGETYLNISAALGISEDTPGGGEDTIFIYSGPSQISENSQVTYQSIFDDLDCSGSYTEYWDWKIILFHAGGNYTLVSQNNVYGYNICNWTKSIGILPSGYNWTKDVDGKILGEVVVGTLDSDDYYHETSKDIKFIDNYANVPYSTSFEQGFDSFWMSSSTENGQVKITSSYGPHSGSKHVTMDVSSNGTYSENSMMLRCALSSTSENTSLDFWWKDFGDENHSQDGIYFSDDGGDSYVKVYNLTPQSYSNNYWRKFTLDVDELASNNNLDMTDNFVIKFQQRDNYKISSDGFAFDDISLNGTLSKPSGKPQEDMASVVPEEYELYQNYPNPFNPSTTINYALKEEVDVKLVVYDILGREVKTLVNRREETGHKSVVWGGRDNYGNQVSTGIYVYRITAGDFVKVRKMIFTK